MKLSRIGILAQKELRSYFFSPMVYILAALFVALIGGIFFNTLMISKNEQVVSIEQVVWPSLFGNMNFIFLVLAPLISMRLFSEEKKQKTLNVLLKSSLSHWEIIFGKLLAAFLVLTFMASLTLVFPFILAFAQAGKIDVPMLALSYCGTMLNILAFLSVGLFASSLTENQIVAALMSFSFLFVLLLLGQAPFVVNNFLVGQILYYVGLPVHFEPFSRGVLRSMDLIYYFSLVGGMSYLTHESLESRHW